MQQMFIFPYLLCNIRLSVRGVRSALPLECVGTGSSADVTVALVFPAQDNNWLTEETENFDKLFRKAALKLIKVPLRDARVCLKRSGRVADVDRLLVVDGVGVRCPAEGRRRLARCGSVAAPQEDAAQSRWLQTAGDHHRLPWSGKDQPDGEIHGWHLLRGVQVHCG